jgi:uncharacterized protein (TIGR00266 family)
VEITIRHDPSFAVARCGLGGGENIRAESGAMMATSAGVSIQAKAQGGMLKSLGRMALGGESFFVSTFTAPGEGGWVDVAANLPGDLVVHEVIDGRALNISRGSFLACEDSVQIDTKWGGFKNLFGGEGGFLVHASGNGTVIVSCYGALDLIDLADGETMVIDSGHMVAYDETVNATLRRVSTTMQSLKSGEGFVFDFVGPGRLYVQSRNPTALIQWLTTALPFSRS